MRKNEMYVVAVKNMVTGERYQFTQGIPYKYYDMDEKTAWAEFHKSVRVMITHKNRLGMKMEDCKYSYVEATIENELKAIAWERGITMEQLKKEIESEKMDTSWILI